MAEINSKEIVEGPKSCYFINWEAMEQLMHDFNGMFSAMQLQKASYAPGSGAAR